MKQFRYHYNFFRATKKNVLAEAGGKTRFFSFSLPCAHELKKVVKLALLEKESKENIINIWKEKYKDEKHVISDYVSTKKYELLKTNRKNNSHFIIPLKNKNGILNFYSQFIDTKLVFITPLENYKKSKTNSIPYITLNFFDELKNKDIVLTKLHILNNSILKQEAYKMYQFLLAFYFDANLFKYVQTFNNDCRNFSYEEFISKFKHMF